MDTPSQIREDIRRRVLVLIAPSAAPNYQEFKCPECDMPVVQLHNTEIMGLTDIIDFDSRKQPLIGVPHKGRRNGLGYCRIRYYYTLGEQA